MFHKTNAKDQQGFNALFKNDIVYVLHVLPSLMQEWENSFIDNLTLKIFVGLHGFQNRDTLWYTIIPFCYFFCRIEKGSRTS